MRLAPASHDTLPNPVAGHSTLDEVLSHNASREPDGVAVVDPALPFPGTWRELDRAASALAAQFSMFGLAADSAVGVQLGSSTLGALTCLALWRAGLTPVMLPLAWRRREMLRALMKVHAGAIVVGAGRGKTACEVAAGLDDIRFVATFGADTPDGATPLDDALTLDAGRVERPWRAPDAADHVAVVTFDAGGVPVARTHNDLVAVGLMPLLAARIAGGARLLSTLDLGGLPGLATGFTPWLVTRATATFHQPTTTAAFAAAARALEATHVTLPGRLAQRLIADGAFDGAAPAVVTAVWRAPDPHGRPNGLGFAGETIVDAVFFGELGLTAAARLAPLKTVPAPLGVASPEGVAPLIETRVAADGRLLVRGPVCPQARYPGSARPAIDAEGFVDTGLVGIPDRAAKRLALDARREGVIQVGGIAVAQGDAETAFTAAGLGGAAETAEDDLFGARIRLALDPAATPTTREGAAEALAEAGFGAALAPASVAAARVRRTA